MDKNQVLTVKIFFLNPIDLITVVLNTLIGMEFESYHINLDEKDDLLNVFEENIRNVLFICVRSQHEVESWKEYIKKVKENRSSLVQIGLFVYDAMKKKDREYFLLEGISVIDFNEIKRNTVLVLRQILTFFEAKGKRAYIRTKTYGESKSYFYLKNRDEPIVTAIHDISAVAFSSTIPEEYQYFFGRGEYLEEVVLVLKGLRIRTAVKVMGFSKVQKGFFVFKLCSTKIQNNKLTMIDELSLENKRKVHEYIKKCLRSRLLEKMKGIEAAEEEITEERESDKTGSVDQAPEKTAPAEETEAAVEEAEDAETVEEAEDVEDAESVDDA